MCRDERRDTDMEEKRRKGKKARDVMSDMLKKKEKKRKK